MSEQFTYEQIENDPTMQIFLRLKTGRATSTITNYIIVIRSFCNFTNKTPTEIRNLHRAELRNHVPEFDQWLSQAFDGYVSFLIDSNYAAGTIKLNISKVKGFLHAFRLRPTPEVEISKDHVSEDSKYSLDVEDIRKAVKNSPPTYQTFFITQAQTGLSLSDAILLDVEDFIQAVSKKNEEITINEAIYRAKNDNMIGCFDLRRKKTSVEFYTFVGPEALHYIASLLESRDEMYLKPKCPIFMKDVSRLSKSKEDYKKDLRLKPDAVKNYVNRMHRSRKIFERIEIDGKHKNYFRTHKLRKWFSNQLRFKAGFSADDTKYLMGQKTGDVLEQYIDTNNYKALKGNYRKALPYLAITEEIVMEENQEAIEKLESENQALRQQMAEMKANIDENQSTTEDLILELINNSKTSNLENMKLPSGKQSLDVLGTILKAEKKNE
jgi:integrase